MKKLKRLLSVGLVAFLLAAFTVSGAACDLSGFPA